MTEIKRINVMKDRGGWKKRWMNIYGIRHALVVPALSLHAYSLSSLSESLKALRSMCYLVFFIASLSCFPHSLASYSILLTGSLSDLFAQTFSHTHALYYLYFSVSPKSAGTFQSLHPIIQSDALQRPVTGNTHSELKLEISQAYSL